MKSNQSQTIDIQGHRGCRGLLPENSLPAFEKAVELGVNTLELDVAVSKDNIVVVSHEPYMSRTICVDVYGKEIPLEDDKKINLYQMTFDSIKQYDCGTKYHPRFPKQEKLKTYKPSLDEVIKSAKTLNPEIKFNIELKSKSEYDGVYTPNPKDFVRLVLEVVNANDAFDESNLQSFDLRILEETKLLSPNMQVAILIDADENISRKLEQLNYKPEIISPYFKLLNKETVTLYQEKDFRVIPWTVNSIKDMKHIIDLHVDGIITDYPDRLIDLLN